MEFRGAGFMFTRGFRGLGVLGAFRGLAGV